MICFSVPGGAPLAPSIYGGCFGFVARTTTVGSVVLVSPGIQWHSGRTRLFRVGADFISTFLLYFVHTYIQVALVEAVGVRVPRRSRATEHLAGRDVQLAAAVERFVHTRSKRDIFFLSSSCTKCNRFVRFNIKNNRHSNLGDRRDDKRCLLPSERTACRCWCCRLISNIPRTIISDFAGCHKPGSIAVQHVCYYRSCYINKYSKMKK